MTYDQIHWNIQGDAYRVPYPALFKVPGKGEWIDPTKSVLWNEQEIQRLRNENARLKQEWRQKQNEADAQFQKDCVAYASGTLGITEKQGSVLFGYAYEKGHANGYYDVLSELQDLIDMMEKFLS